ncbi:MAG: hypothetical protein PHP20_03365 [Firmicutes bacterium]|nr:hypothetical protein [Bacillota bacterium]
MSEDGRFSMDLMKMPGLKPLLLLAGLGILLIIVGSLIKTSAPKSSKTADPYPIGDSISSETGSSSRVESQYRSDLTPADKYRIDLETRAAAILSRIDGAGAVSVQVTLEGSAYRKYAFDTVEETKSIDEKLSASESRVTTEKRETRDLVLPSDSASGRGQSPVLVQEVYPSISGVLVAAPGARDSRIKRELAEAAQTLLGVPAHRVMVVAAGAN